MKYIVKTRIQAHVLVRCEACNCDYRYARTLMSVQDADDKSPGPTVEEQAADTANFGFKRCPQCRHYQSWMIPNYKFGVGCLVSVLVFFATAIIACWWAGLPPYSSLQELLTVALTPMVLFVVSLIMCHFLLRPRQSAQDQERHGPQHAPRLIQPHASVDAVDAGTYIFDYFNRKHWWD